VHLQGLQQSPLSLTTISATKVFNSAKGNDVWAYVLVDQHKDTLSPPNIISSTESDQLKLLLAKYKDVLLTLKFYHPIGYMITQYLCCLLPYLSTLNLTIILHFISLK